MYCGGESLATAGVYREAEIKVLYQGTKSEKTVVVQPFKVIKEPIYHEALQITTLGSSFVEMALTRPIKPRSMNMGRFLRTSEGKAFQNWNKMSNVDKLQMRVEEYAENEGCTIRDWELL